ncbi:hypothetical protein [Paenibacillus sp. FSL H3-0333]|uniref:hypothetical protein n=1 Tax=Paenibacillus sp. FSL H3-0333 TaxID=2921373 RepID=UPI0030F9392D
MAKKKTEVNEEKLQQENHMRDLKKLEDRLFLIPDPSYSFDTLKIYHQKISFILKDILLM